MEQDQIWKRAISGQENKNPEKCPLEDSDPGEALGLWLGALDHSILKASPGDLHGW